MGLITNLVNGMQGNDTDSPSDGMFDTPYGGNTIAEATLTKAQKTFSSQEITPNLPKPKTLYFVYFHLNPALKDRIVYMNKFIETLSSDGGLNSGSFIANADVRKIESDILNDIRSAYSDNVRDKSKLSSIISSKFEKKSSDKVYGGYKNKTSESVLDYIPTKDLFDKLSFEISKMVKSYDKPGISSLDATEFNEYNRKRYVYTGIKYKDIKISFYDVKESPVQQFFIAYLKFINSDLFCKNSKIWQKPIDNCHWQNALGYKANTVDGGSTTVNGTYYGNLNSFGLNIDSNFRLIDRISFCEYYMNKMTVYTIENPVITSIDFGTGEMGEFKANDITISFKYEGITNDLMVDDIEKNTEHKESLIGYLSNLWQKAGKDQNSTTLELKCMVNHSIRKDVANFMQTRYSTWGGKLASDITSTLKAYMNGDIKFSWNTLKNQTLDTMRKYNMAGLANTYAKAEQTIKNYKSKDSKGQAKYLVNMFTDPTSFIGTGTIGIADSGRGGNFDHLVV